MANASTKAHREFLKLLGAKGITIEGIRREGQKAFIYFRDAGGSLHSYPLHGLRTPTAQRNSLAAVMRIVRGAHSGNGGVLSPPETSADEIVKAKFANLPPGGMRHRVPPRPPKPVTSGPSLPLFPAPTEAAPENPTMNAETNGHASKRGAKVYLSPQERYQLTRWLDTNWKEIEESKQPMREALATAKAALGVPQLTLGHFQTALAGIGKSWPTGPGRGDKHAARTLARAIITLYEQLDVEIPPDLAALAVRH